jgi:hypothetical protein
MSEVSEQCSCLPQSYTTMTPAATAKCKSVWDRDSITKLTTNPANSCRKSQKWSVATNWDHLRRRSYWRDVCERVGNVWVYHNSIHAIYTTVQCFYCQNRHDGDRYLNLPQDTWLVWVLRCKIKQKRGSLQSNQRRFWFTNQYQSRGYLNIRKIPPSAIYSHRYFRGIPAASLQK